MAVSIRQVDDDATLVRAVQDGDRDAFTELFRRHYPTVRRVCARRLRNLRDADEVAQAAFVRAYERIALCDGERRFGPWVMVIAQRLCIDHIRVQARTGSGTDDEQLREAPAVGLYGPEETVLRHEREHQLHTALAALPDRQRRVVIARDVEGRRPAEIAAALGLSIGAVDSLLLRARRRLATQYAAASAESGLVSLPAAGAGTAAAALAGSTGGGRLARMAGSVSDMVGSLSAHVGTAFTHVPSLSGVAQDVAAGIVAGVLVLAPFVGADSPQPVRLPRPAVGVVAPDLAPPVGAIDLRLPVPASVTPPSSSTGADTRPTRPPVPVAADLAGVTEVAPAPLAEPVAGPGGSLDDPDDGGVVGPPPSSVALLPADLLAEPLPAPAPAAP